MPVSLESLDLTAEQLQCAREAVQTAAYIKWEQAGRPCDSGEVYWIEAEREWIERCYVPPRLPSLPDAPVGAISRARRPQRETVGT